jgi:hypothetical protein
MIVMREILNVGFAGSGRLSTTRRQVARTAAFAVRVSYREGDCVVAVKAGCGDQWGFSPGR